MQFSILGLAYPLAVTFASHAEGELRFVARSTASTDATTIHSSFSPESLERRGRTLQIASSSTDTHFIVTSAALYQGGYSEQV